MLTGKIYPPNTRRDDLARQCGINIRFRLGERLYDFIKKKSPALLNVLRTNPSSRLIIDSSDICISYSLINYCLLNYVRSDLSQIFRPYKLKFKIESV